jgi:ABC-type sugar transport system ATPase subunit
MDSDVGANLAYVAVALNRRPWMPPPRSLSEFARSTIERLMIKTSGPSQGVSTLSGGNQQKVLIGKWLSIPMHVLLLSDPTKGVDVHARKEIYALVQELVADGRAAIVYASDVMELMEFCDRIIVMCEGRVTANLSGDAITEHRITSASFAGTDRMEA